MVTVFDSELPWITDESAHNRATSWCVPLPTFGQLKSVEISWNQRHYVSHVATEAEDLLEARGARWASLTAEKEKLQQITRSNTKFQEVLIYVDLFRSLISLDILEELFGMQQIVICANNIVMKKNKSSVMPNWSNVIRRDSRRWCNEQPEPWQSEVWAVK